MEREIISTNLKRIRAMRGLSQARVAEKAGMSRLAYRNIETGKSEPRVSSLQNIARALDVKLQDLVTPVKTLRAVRFRAAKRMTSREHVLADVARWLEDFNELERFLGDWIPYTLCDLAHSMHELSPGQERARHAAAKARGKMGLSPNEPIRDICGLLEAQGVKIHTVRLASDAFFGLSVAECDGGPAVTVNVWERISVERWIFSAAHELGHLLLHLDAYDVDESEEVESQEIEANVFASHFLMPQDAFEQEWRETYGHSFLDRVLKVKRIFKVSYKTVLYRLSETLAMRNRVWGMFQNQYRRRAGKTLGKSDEPYALSKHEFQAPESLKAHEPDGLSKSDFIEDRLSELVRRAIETNRISLSRGAEILRLDLSEMREIAAFWVE